MSSPIVRRFAALAAEERKALVCYVTAGHPTLEASEQLLAGLSAAGTDIIELGVPFSDPLADGPVIQRSSQVAIENGAGFQWALDLLDRTRPDSPVVLFTYLNPLLAAGVDALQRAADAGAAGILVTDLPLGADPALEDWLAAGPLDFIRLVAPTTPVDRMRAIATRGSGFVYLISRLGVTGEKAVLSDELPQTTAQLRSVTDLPICVGFGISGPAQAREAAALCDGVVVGSALVRAAGDAGVDGALELVRSMRHALDSVPTRRSAV